MIFSKQQPPLLKNYTISNPLEQHLQLLSREKLKKP